MNPQHLRSAAASGWLWTALCLGPAPVLAQIDQGPTLAVAQAFSVDAATLPTAAGTVFFTASDFDANPPGTWNPQPGFALPNFGALFAGQSFDVDALSVGLDWILALPSGEVPFPLNGAWGAVSLSVTPGTSTASGAIGAELGPGGNGAAADLFAYSLPGSNLPAPLVDVTFRGQDSTEIALAAGANLDAHDIYLSLVYGQNPQLVQQQPAPPLWPPTVYFSVTAATAAAVPPAWWGGNPPSGAIVLRSTWDPNTATWSVPGPFLLPAQLGLNAGEELDALAVDTLRGFVLFSTESPGRDPLLFHDANGPGGHATYRLQAGHPAGGPASISSRIGIGIGNIDAICTLDPGTLGGARYLQATLGTPYAHDPNLPPLPIHLGAALYRRRNSSTGNEELLSWMTGVPGSPPPAVPGVAVIALQLGGIVPAGLPGPAAAGYLTGNVYLRPKPGYAGFAGLPQCHTIAIPGNLNLMGAELFVVWGAVNASAFTVSFPIGITL